MRELNLKFNIARKLNSNVTNKKYLNIFYFLITFYIKYSDTIIVTTDTMNR